MITHCQMYYAFHLTFAPDTIRERINIGPVKIQTHGNLGMFMLSSICQIKFELTK